MKRTPRPLNKMLQDRLALCPAEQRPAKLFELQVAELLVRSGELGMGTALTVAERLCKDQPRKLAELMHRISNDFLHSTVPQEKTS
jgi:hypothetical protein